MVIISISGLEFELERNVHAFMSSNVLSLPGDFWVFVCATPEGEREGALSVSSGTRFICCELGPALHQLLDLGQIG